MIPCQILGITHSINILEEGVVEVFVSAMVQPVGRHGKAIRLASFTDDSDKKTSCSPKPSDSNQDSSFILDRTRLSPSHTAEDASRSQSFETVLRTHVAGDSDSYGDAEVKKKHRNESISSNESATHERGNNDSSVDILQTTAAEQTGNVNSVRKMTSTSPDREGESGSGGVLQETSFLSPIGPSGNRRRSPSYSKTAAPSDRVRSASYGSTTVSESMVMLSSLPSIPGARIIKYLGPVQLHFIKVGFPNSFSW